MKRVLFIAYEFPPLKLGGVYRPLGFVNFLKELGYEPIIITLAKSAMYRYNPNHVEDTLGLEIRENNIIVEVDSELKHSNEKSRVKSFIDTFLSPNGIEAKYWRNNFNEVISKCIAEYKPQILFVTAPPFSIVELAVEASKKYKLPLVTDLRDAWSNWFTAPYPTYLHYWYKQRKENSALQNSTIVTVTSKQTINDFILLNPSVDRNKYRYLPNGYNGELQQWINDLGKKEVIKIGYVGSFYFSPSSRNNLMMPRHQKKLHKRLQYVPNLQDWLYRTPFFFFKTLQELFRLNPEFKNKIKVEFAGEKADWLLEMIEEFGLQQNVKLLGYISHQQSLSFQRECDLLLITSAKVIGGKDYSIAGKTFEYFQNQKPILAFVCEGAQKEILEESGMAIICNPDEIENSAAILAKAISGNVQLKPNIEFIQKHSRKELTKSLVQIFDSILIK